MKTKNNVTYLTRAEWDAFKEEEHRERVELTRRVERGELSALEANREASMFKFVPSTLEVPINFAEAAERLLGVKLRRNRNGRRRKNAIRH